MEALEGVLIILGFFLGIIVNDPVYFNSIEKDTLELVIIIDENLGRKEEINKILDSYNARATFLDEKRGDRVIIPTNFKHSSSNQKGVTFNQPATLLPLIKESERDSHPFVLMLDKPFELEKLDAFLLILDSKFNVRYLTPVEMSRYNSVFD